VRGRQEARIGVRAAVVRHLEHVRLQVHAVPHQAGLGLGTEVAGQQDPQAADRDAGDDGQVVRLGTRGGALRRRRKDLHLDVAERPSVAGR
jgi:hypothetical protein